MSFLKTLKREAIYAKRYQDLRHLRTNVAGALIGYYYNSCRLHSALGYRSLEEFKQAAASRRSHQGRNAAVFQPTESVYAKGVPSLKETVCPTGVC